MLSLFKKSFFLKLFSLFSVVRGYNIIVIVVAQYLTASFILAPHLELFQVFLDVQLFIIVLVSAIVIASGYIINNFYDLEKDIINRPNKVILDTKISQQTRLTTYFVLNFLSVIFASYVSFKAVIFFSFYIFSIWFYSHKLKKLPVVGNITAAILSITPFFAVFIYYKNFDKVIFIHAQLLFLVLIMREMIKDLENLKGDLVQNYRTIPVVYGESVSKIVLTILVFIAFIPLYILGSHYDTGYIFVYFYGSSILFLFFLILLWKASKKNHYLNLHVILKIIIVSGTLSIVFLNPEALKASFFIK